MRSVEHWLTVFDKRVYQSMGSHTRNCLHDLIEEVQTDAAGQPPANLPGGLVLSDEQMTGLTDYLDYMGQVTSRNMLDQSDIDDLLNWCRSLLKERRSLVNLLRDCEDLDAYASGWKARTEYGEWTALGTLSVGDVCETEGMDVLAVVELREYGNTVRCVSLREGIVSEWGVDTRVRKVTVNW